jgi:hypothetical protein
MVKQGLYNTPLMNIAAKTKYHGASKHGHRGENRKIVARRKI